MIKSCEVAGFLEWVQSGAVDSRDVQNWILDGAGRRKYVDAYEHFILKRREL